ncbi:MAG: hypothetical protein WCR27_10415 [Eubacteriales bacterium]
MVKKILVGISDTDHQVQQASQTEELERKVKSIVDKDFSNVCAADKKVLETAGLKN